MNEIKTKEMQNSIVVVVNVTDELLLEIASILKRGKRAMVVSPSYEMGIIKNIPSTLNGKKFNKFGFGASKDFRLIAGKDY